MFVRTNVEISFTTEDSTIYSVGDDVQVKSESLEVNGRIVKIYFVGFEIATCDDERVITIKFEDLVSIKKNNPRRKGAISKKRKEYTKEKCKSWKNGNTRRKKSNSTKEKCKKVMNVI